MDEEEGGWRSTEQPQEQADKSTAAYKAFEPGPP